MKKLILALLIVGLVATTASAEFYRVIVDVPFENANHALQLVNLIETHKDKVMAEETKDGYIASAKLVKSWDSELVNKPEQTLLFIDFSTATVTHTLADTLATQGLVNRLTTRKNYLEAKVTELETKITTLQAEVNAQNP